MTLLQRKTQHLKDFRKLILNELRKREWVTTVDAVALKETLPETSVAPGTSGWK